MSTNQLEFYQFEGAEVRCIKQGDEPWFVAADVCRVLGITNSRQAVGRLHTDNVGVCSTYTKAGVRQASIVNESGLYALIMASRKAEAMRFQRWVTSTVLPAIRKTGSYVKGEESAKDPDALIDLNYRAMLRKLDAMREDHQAELDLHNRASFGPLRNACRHEMRHLDRAIRSCEAEAASIRQIQALRAERNRLTRG